VFHQLKNNLAYVSASFLATDGITPKEERKLHPVLPGLLAF